MPEPNARPKTHYDLLGVKPTASPQQIRQAFREMSKLYHPDTTTLPANEATEKFQQLNEAYGILSSPDRRWTYDKQVGYSRISVMQPLEPLSRASKTIPQRREPSNLYLDPNDRPLSAGEIFALFILGLTFVACLALVITVGLVRGDYADDLEAPATAQAPPPAMVEPSIPPTPAPPDASLDDSSPPLSAPALPAPRSSPSRPASPPTWL